MAPLIGRFYNDRANGRASLACKDLLLLANGRAQAKRKCPVVQTLNQAIYLAVYARLFYGGYVYEALASEGLIYLGCIPELFFEITTFVQKS